MQWSAFSSSTPRPEVPPRDRSVGSCGHTASTNALGEYARMSEHRRSVRDHEPLPQRAGAMTMSRYLAW